MPREISYNLYKKDIIENDLPFRCYYDCAVIYNNKIHILGGYSSDYLYKHYSWNGTNWIEESALPYDFYGGGVVVYDNKIHILGSARYGEERVKHYSWNGTNWIEESTLPYDFNSGCAVVYDNKIHILGNEEPSSNRTKHYSWNGIQWIQESTLPYALWGGSAVIYNNKIHILGGRLSNDSYKHYSWNGTNWIEESVLPYEFDLGKAIIYNNKIHILGGYGNNDLTKHYSWNGVSWVKESILPYKTYQESAVVYDNKIHILGAITTGNARIKHFSLEYYADTNVNKVDFGEENLIDLTEDTLEYSSQVLQGLIAHNKQGNFIKGTRPVYYKTNSSKYAVVCNQPIQSYDGMDDPAIYLGGQYIKLRLASGATKIQLVSMKTDGVTESVLDLATLTAGYTDQFFLKRVRYISDRCCMLQYYNWTSTTSHTVYTFRMLLIKTDGSLLMGAVSNVWGVATNTSYLDADAWWLRPFYKRSQYTLTMDIAVNSTANTTRLRGFRSYYNTVSGALGYATAGIFGHRSSYYSNTELPNQYIAPSMGGIFCKFNNTEYINTLFEYNGSYKSIPLANADASGEMAAIGAEGHHMLGMTTGGLMVTAKENNKLYLWSFDTNGTSDLYSKINEFDFSNFGRIFKNISTLPCTFNYKGVVVYNNKIHILYGTEHYSWDGTTWIKESTLPYEFYVSCAVVYDNKIHILGSSSSYYYTKHYSWNGITWTEESTLPYEFYYSSAVIYDNKIHILGSEYSINAQKHYSWDGTTWTEESTLPYGFDDGSAVVYDNKIHILSSYYGNSQLKHSSWDGTEWNEESILPYKFYFGSAVVYNNKIHILGGGGINNRTNHYSWNGITWTEESILPYYFYRGGAVVYNNKIHILGGYDNYTKHYSYTSNDFNILSFSNDVLLLDNGRRIQVTPNKLVELEPLEIQYAQYPEDRAYIGPESDPWEGVFIYGD